MSWFEKLKDLIKVNINLSKFININIANRPDKKEKHFVSQDGKCFNVNYPSLELNEKNKLKTFIKKEFEEGKTDIIELSSSYRLNDINKKLNTKLVREILEFYKDKISEKHYKSLEASLYLRQVFDSGGSVSELKRDIVHKFGDDGRNICNLCSAGYFEGYIKDVYIEISSSQDFSIDQFKKYFERIVNTKPFAIFVHKEMSEEEISGEINYKLNTYKKYGIKFLDIHGIGRDNIIKIKKIIQEFEEKYKLKVDILQEKNIIQVRIFLIYFNFFRR